MVSVILVIFGVWLAVLSAAFYWLFTFFRKLTKGSREGDLVKVLDRILKIQAKTNTDLSLLKKEIGQLEKEGQLHIQKVGVIRFNPFAETGGDHSFVLTLLDGSDSGVILTCLHTRERTRVYLKAIEKGKSEQELSGEEKRALKVAQKS